MAEKRQLKISLAKFEAEFEVSHNRKITREERNKSRGADYRRYAELKILTCCQGSDLCFSPTTEMTENVTRRE